MSRRHRYRLTPSNCASPAPLGRRRRAHSMRSASSPIVGRRSAVGRGLCPRPPDEPMARLRPTRRPDCPPHGEPGRMAGTFRSGIVRQMEIPLVAAGDTRSSASAGLLGMTPRRQRRFLNNVGGLACPQCVVPHPLAAGRTPESASGRRARIRQALLSMTALCEAGLHPACPTQHQERCHPESAAGRTRDLQTPNCLAPRGFGPWLFAIRPARSGRYPIPLAPFDRTGAPTTQPFPSSIAGRWAVGNTARSWPTGSSPWRSKGPPGTMTPRAMRRPAAEP